MRPDPIGFLGGDLNLYVYVWSNPTRYNDLSGLQTAVVPAPGPVPIPVVLPVTPEQQVANQQLGNTVWTWLKTHYNPDNYITEAYRYWRGKAVDYEKEKQKLTVGNVPRALEYGGPCKEPELGPDDECERLASYIQSPFFKKEPIYKRVLTTLMYYFGCR